MRGDVDRTHNARHDSRILHCAVGGSDGARAGDTIGQTRVLSHFIRQCEDAECGDPYYTPAEQASPMAISTSHRRRLWLAIFPMLLAVAALVALAATSMLALSGVRAYVGGEGLWSKAQKDAIYYLVRYARSASPSDFQRYEAAISVPLGDRVAREALDRPSERIDYDAARRGFLQGRNNSDDIDVLSAIFVHFRTARFIASAIDIWAQGDRLIERVNADATQLQIAVKGPRDPVRIEALVADLHSLNEQLQPLEDAFSFTLGQASRWATRTLIVTLMGLGLTMLLAAVLTYGRELSRTLTAEAALRESQEVLSLAMRGGRMGAWVRDLTTNEVWQSRELEELFGLPVRGFKGTEDDFFKIVHEQDRVPLAKAVETAIATGRDYAIEFRFRQGSGPWRWMDGRGRATYAEDGRATRLFGIGIDITERRQAEESARQNEAHFRTMADAIPQLVWMARPDGSIYWYNRRWYEYTGTTPADVEGWGWQRVHDPAVLPTVLERWKSSIASGEPFDMVFPLRGADGAYRTFLTRVMPLKDERRVLHWFGTCTDITSQIQAEEALRSADQRKDAFIATLAHELRNPLAPIRNAIEIMRLQYDASPIQITARDIIDRQAKHLTHLVDDLLEASRISRGKVQLRMERMALAAPLTEAIEAAHPLIQSMAHTLTVNLPSETLYLAGDPTRITQVVLNLLNNAAKFTPSGGHIWLSVERIGDEAVIRVRDTGTGISAADLPQIFDMFFQVTPPVERAAEGLGIGLALVRGLVELHGGTVQASSGGFGRGSEFIVRLPLASPADRPSRASSSVAQQPVFPCVRRKVLVVDDNRDAAESLSQLLQLFGHDVREAYDGVEAVHAAEVFRPDFILLDLGLPKLNGYDTAREIRKRAGERALRIIAVTGWGQNKDRRHSAAAGFDQHLTKPVDSMQLQAILNQTIELPSLQSS